MQILPSARKHGIPDADIFHAWENAIRVGVQQFHGEYRLLVVGPDRGGAMLELVAVPAVAPARIIHADRLRPSRYDYLR